MYWNATARGVAPGKPKGSSAVSTARSEVMGGGRLAGRGFWVMGTTSGPALAGADLVGLRLGDPERLPDCFVEFFFGVWSPVSLLIGKTSLGYIFAHFGEHLLKWWRPRRYLKREGECRFVVCAGLILFGRLGKVETI